MTSGRDTTIELRLSVTRDDGPVSYDQAKSIVDQIYADAMWGTFGEIASEPRSPSNVRLRVDSCATPTTIEFDLILPDGFLPGPEWALQHLLGILASDVVPSLSSGCRVRDFTVSSVRLGEGLEQELVRAFRDGAAHDISSLRELFKLDQFAPLMGYAFKPRSGLTFEQTRTSVLGVLHAGFNYVVLDTRNTDARPGQMEPWLELVKEAASLDVAHVTAFSPNLSMPSVDLLPTVEAVIGCYGPGQPAVIKIDGGLDGISGIQAVRRQFAGKCRPVISTYPLLQPALRKVVPDDGFMHWLALSGADLGYPGGRPGLPNEVRPIWSEEETALSRSLALYDRILERGWPTPVLAGGVHPGQLHALYELLGPQVGLFLGGAVALHRDGPVAGAKLCVKIVREASDLAREAKSRGEVVSEMLSTKTVSAIEECYGLTYLPPGQLFSRAPKLRRWYQR